MAVTNVQQEQINDGTGNYVEGYIITFTIGTRSDKFTAEVLASGDPVATAAAAIAAQTQTVEGIYGL